MAVTSGCKLLTATTVYFSEFPLNNVCLFAGNWHEVLQKHIDPDELPAFYGGNLTDPDGDPRCKTMVSKEHQLLNCCFSQRL